MEETNRDLVNSIKSNSLDLLSEYGEITLDATLESGVLKDIPIFGSIVKLSKIGVTIRDYLFINKLKTFLTNISNIPLNVRKNFVDEYYKNENKSYSLGEKLIHTIENIDSTKKAAYVGKAFKLYALKKIDNIEFFDLVYAIENFKLHYTDIFLSSCLSIKSHDVKKEILEHFSTCGLSLIPANGLILKHERHRINYSLKGITDLGRLFLEHIIEYNKQEIKTEFYQTILNIKITNKYKDEDYKESEVITKEELSEILSKKTLKELFYYSVHSDNTISNFHNSRFRIISRREEDVFVLYKDKLKKKK
ncbi:hypothetical protein [Aquimarina spongiae]|uniref:Uncharacterized protein n=1 Tax=Aquimarina spongiae TaxID=570521 RepID=A0A1M6B7Q1_9FLAO|nr:hypothetical protein [Aquimarina spongiae]SHI44720.1 hypothetical protein SAMN04488508_101671 [Aquimarina spongiae]